MMDFVSADKNVPAVKGTNSSPDGGSGVEGYAVGGVGVFGRSTFHAVWGWTEGANSAGVFGNNVSGTGFGVVGDVRQQDHQGRGVGVAGYSDEYQGGYGHSSTNAGVVGEADHFHAIYGVAHDVNSSGVFASNDAGGFGVSGISERGVGLYGEGNVAGRFKGTGRSAGTSASRAT